MAWGKCTRQTEKEKKVNTLGVNLSKLIVYFRICTKFRILLNDLNNSQKCAKLQIVCQCMQYCLSTFMHCKIKFYCNRGSTKIDSINTNMKIFHRIISSLILLLPSAMYSIFCNFEFLAKVTDCLTSRSCIHIQQTLSVWFSRAHTSSS